MFTGIWLIFSLILNVLEGLFFLFFIGYCMDNSFLYSDFFEERIYFFVTIVTQKYSDKINVYWYSAPILHFEIFDTASLFRFFMSCCIDNSFLCSNSLRKEFIYEAQGYQFFNSEKISKNKNLYCSWCMFAPLPT